MPSVSSPETEWTSQRVALKLERDLEPGEDIPPGGEAAVWIIHCSGQIYLQNSTENLSHCCKINFISIKMKQVTSWSPTIVTQLGHKWLPSAFEKSNPPSEDQYAINSEDYRQMRYAHPWGQNSPLGQHRKVHTPIVAVWKGATHKWNH